ncbi:MAG TPA: PHP domain-containing protein [Bacteroidales bacterium]|nr:PHP domain-containing protein [Bacteroidales bacterium]
MKKYRADLHIHTVLSPCGDLSMSPENIISEAEKKDIDIIGITDHNSTRHCKLISRLAAKRRIFTMMGAEVTTKEEVHCLTFFENTDTLDLFQGFLESHLPDILNDPDIFGDQVEVDENEKIIFTETRLLSNAIDVSIDELQKFVSANNGIFIPAHIDRLKNGLYGQLGFLPDNFRADALEVSWRNVRSSFAAARPELSAHRLITNSDAHITYDIGRALTEYWLEYPSFEELKMALNNLNGRKIAG